MCAGNPTGFGQFLKPYRVCPHAVAAKPAGFTYKFTNHNSRLEVDRLIVVLRKSLITKKSRQDCWLIMWVKAA
jgi:hypothetical protein